MEKEKSSLQRLRDDIAAAFRHFPLSAAGVIAPAVVLPTVPVVFWEKGAGVREEGWSLACFLGYACLAATIADAWKKGGPHFGRKIGLIIGLAVLAWWLTWHPPVPALHGARPITVPAMFLLLLTLSVLAQLRDKAAGPWLAHALAVCLGVGVLVPSIAAGLTVVGAPLMLIFALMGDSSGGGGGSDAGLFGLTLGLWAFAVGGTVCCGLWSVLGRIGEFSPEEEQSRQERSDGPNRFLCFAAVCCLFGEAWYAALVFFGEATATNRSAFHAVFWFAAFALLLLWCRTTARRPDRWLIGLLCGLVVAALWTVCAHTRQYGLTPLRYLAAAGLLWLLFAYALAFLSRDCRPALRALIGVILFSMWTPLGAVPMSVKSQQARLAALEKVPKNLERMDNLIEFLQRYGASASAALPGMEFLATDRPQTYGKKFRRPKPPEPVVSIEAELPLEGRHNRIFDVSGYDYLMMQGAAPEKTVEHDRIKIRRSGNKLVEIHLDDVLEVAVDLAELLVAGIPRETGRKQYSCTIGEDKRLLRVGSERLDVAFHVAYAKIVWEFDAIARKDREKALTDLACVVLVGLRRNPAETEPQAPTESWTAAGANADVSGGAGEPGVRLAAKLPFRSLYDRIFPVAGWDYALAQSYGGVCGDGDLTVRHSEEDQRVVVMLGGVPRLSVNLVEALVADAPRTAEGQACVLGEDKRRLAFRSADMEVAFVIERADMEGPFDARADRRRQVRDLRYMAFIRPRRGADGGGRSADAGSAPTAP